MSFWLFCLLLASNHLHLTARVPALGAIRFDYVLALAAVLTMFFTRPKNVQLPPEEKTTTRRLVILIAYAVLALPFARWPGSVIDHGFEIFLRAVIYYFLVVGTVRTEKQLAIFFATFAGTQIFRVLEPLYLHMKDGYWGASTNMGNWTAMDRLSGAPDDIVNPNGLAYLVVSTLPIVFFAQMRMKMLHRAIAWVVMGAMIYTLILTGSRSGFLVLAMIVGVWVWTSKYRTVAIAALLVFGAVVVAGMSELQRDRYLSIYRSDVPGAATAQGRLDGVVADFGAAMARPIFGHGLGTSYEVNTWVRPGGVAQISHNTYAETSQELGFVGLGIFLAYIWSAMKGSWNASKALRGRDYGPALTIAGQVMPVMMATLFVFSFATYGLSEYHWYLLGGMGVVTMRLVNARTRAAAGDDAAQPAAPPGRGPSPARPTLIRPRTAQFSGRK